MVMYLKEGIMRQAVLDKKIHGFIERKQDKYPELNQSVTMLTRQLELDGMRRSLESDDPEEESRESSRVLRQSYFAHMNYAL